MYGVVGLAAAAEAATDRGLDGYCRSFDTFASLCRHCAALSSSYTHPHTHFYNRFNDLCSRWTRVTVVTGEGIFIWRLCIQHKQHNHSAIASKLNTKDRVHTQTKNIQEQAFTQT